MTGRATSTAAVLDDLCDWRARIAAAGADAAARPAGRVRAVSGLAVRVEGLAAGIGDLVVIDDGGRGTPAEVVAITPDDVAVLPLGPTVGLRAGTRVRASGGQARTPVGPALRGRVLDALGRPLDGRPLPPGLPTAPVDAAAPDAMTRARVTDPMPVGVRAVDTLTPIGRGQRMGIFAGSGVGKSTLLSMITRGTSADLVVLALVGERGREVREFLDDDLGPEGLARAVVVVATSDQPPLMRLRAAFTATAIAEAARAEGQDVLLLMDSVTRVAMAQREVGLSVGEPPATRGYPPSVFALLPRLLERAGCDGAGSITALYTVLVEGDDHNEPVADTVRSLLDGHLVLDRRLAVSGHFPSIDVVASVSRTAHATCTPAQRDLSTSARALLAARADVAELVEIGAYVPGGNPLADEALARWNTLAAFLRQPREQGSVPAAQAWADLAAVLGREQVAA